MYIHQHENWTDFSWDTEKVSAALVKLRYRQGRLLGKMEGLGFQIGDEAQLSTLSLDVVHSNEIEGENLDMEQVRSSIARHLGLEIAVSAGSTRHVDSVVEMMLDATQNYALPLTQERLFGWHAGLFPAGFNGIYKIATGKYRTGHIEVISGSLGNPKVHFEGPDASRIDNEMARFFDWFNGHSQIDPVLKAAVAHLWFVTIHPFEDGNGRIARGLADMQLARGEGSSRRFYSMSSRILTERKRYYQVLETTQQGDGNITEWLEWFLVCLERAIEDSEITLAGVLSRARFWEAHAQTLLNARQQKMLNLLLGHFEGKLTSSKWAKITGCSPDTALRDIQDLINKGILYQEEGGGRSTGYGLLV
ncbi:cell division protein Fic [Spirochaetia bacterium]|nr:cell division protein Fic [Spirochaetia bacterium]